MVVNPERDEHALHIVGEALKLSVILVDGRAPFLWLGHDDEMLDYIDKADLVILHEALGRALKQRKKPKARTPCLGKSVGLD